MSSRGTSAGVRIPSLFASCPFVFLQTNKMRCIFQLNYSEAHLRRPARRRNRFHRPTPQRCQDRALRLIMSEFPDVPITAGNLLRLGVPRRSILDRFMLHQRQLEEAEAVVAPQPAEEDRPPDPAPQHNSCDDVDRVRLAEDTPYYPSHSVYAVADELNWVQRMKAAALSMGSPRHHLRNNTRFMVQSALARLRTVAPTFEKQHTAATSPLTR